jgi:hypothetical protein
MGSLQIELLRAVTVGGPGVVHQLKSLGRLCPPGGSIPGGVGRQAYSFSKSPLRASFPARLAIAMVWK